MGVQFLLGSDKLYFDENYRKVVRRQRRRNKFKLTFVRDPSRLLTLVEFNVLHARNAISARGIGGAWGWGEPGGLRGAGARVKPTVNTGRHINRHAERRMNIIL